MRGAADIALACASFVLLCPVEGPVQADINVSTLCADPERQPPALCSRYMPEFSGSQQTLQSFFTKKGAADDTVSQTKDGMPRSASAVVGGLSAPSVAAASNTLKRPLSLNSTQQSAVASPAKKARGSASGPVKQGGAAAAGSRSMKDFFGAKPTATAAKAEAVDLLSDAAEQALIAPAADKSAACPAASSPRPSSASPYNDAAALPAEIVSASAAASSPPAASAASSLSAAKASSPPAPAASASASASSLSPSAFPSSSSSSSSFAWAALLDQKSTSVQCRCGHQCKLLTVTKQGANQGRKFYICPIPPPQRCEFFTWASQAQSTAAKTKR